MKLVDFNLLVYAKENGIYLCDKEYLQEKSSFEQAWTDCPRGDWMMYIAYKLGVDRKRLIYCNVQIARTVQHLMKDERSVKALDVFEKYSLGKATIEEFEGAEYQALDSAANAANDAYAAYNAYNAASSAASNAAVASANAANASANAAANASSAASNAAVASNAARSVASKNEQKNQQQTADICRELLTEEVFWKIREI